MNSPKKPWKGYKSLDKPNQKECHICNSFNADWFFPEQVMGNTSVKFPEVYVHYICLYKSSHYDKNPKEYSKWLCEFSKVRKQVLERDNHTCVICNNESKYCIKKMKEKKLSFMGVRKT